MDDRSNRQKAERTVFNRQDIRVRTWLLIFAATLLLCGVVDSVSNLGNNLGDLVGNALNF